MRIISELENCPADKVSTEIPYGQVTECILLFSHD